MADTQYRITTNGKRFRIEQQRLTYTGDPLPAWDALNTYETREKAERMLDLLKDREGPWVPVEDAAVQS